MHDSGGMPLFLCLTNIPSLYRLQQFEALHKEFAARGIDFEAVFMADTEPGRHWQFCPEQWSFQARVLRGVRAEWRSAIFHLNAGIVPHLLRQRPNWLMIGGGWMLPTVALASLSSRFFLPRTARLFWTEGSLSYTHYSREGVGRFLKRASLAGYHGFVVPGQASKDYLVHLFQEQRKTIPLPNFLDEERYSAVAMARQDPERRAQLREELGFGQQMIFLCPARLVPEKGILEFLTSIAGLPKDLFSILLAGDGPLDRNIETLITERQLTHVKMLGHQSTSQLLRLYELSDVLLLPSLRETYGFVTVEGLWSGLPLLLSERVGATAEVLEPGINGWTFDPLDGLATKSAVERFLGLGTAGLLELGRHSLEIAQSRFSSSASARVFVDSLLSAFPVKDS